MTVPHTETLKQRNRPAEQGRGGRRTCGLGVIGLSAILWLTVVATGGCGPWNKAGSQVSAVFPANFPLGSRPNSGRGLVLAVAVVEYRDHELKLVEQIWDEADQQAIGIDACRVLDSNGMRCGVLSSHLSGGLAQLLETELPVVADALPGLVEAFDDESLPTRSRMRGMRMQFQPDVMREVPVSGTFALVDWAITSQERVTRGFAANAQGAIQILPKQVDDSGATIELLAGFREASSQPLFESGQHDFQFGSQQQFHALAELAIESRLRRGQTLLLGPTHVTAADELGVPVVGQLFFGDDRQQGYTGLRRMLMVRLESLPLK